MRAALLSKVVLRRSRARLDAARAKLATYKASKPLVVQAVDAIMAEMHQQIGEGAEMFRREVEVFVSLFAASLCSLLSGLWSYAELGITGHPSVWPLVPWFVFVFLIARFLPR